MAEDKHTEKNFIRYLKAAIPVCTVFVIFMCVLAAKGIFPFGGNTIDYYDMGQTNAPLYFHIWDVLHGKSTLFFDWYINGGQNLSMGSAIQWNISVFNLVFLLIPRDMVMRFLSVYTLLRLMAMTASMQFFLYKMTPDTGYRVRGIFSVAYGLCGFALTHYTIPTYLDSVVFLPILIFMLFRLLRHGKPWGYVFILGYTTALSYYLGLMHLIYLLIIGGAYIILIAEKEVKKDRAGKLVMGTMGGIFLSSVITVPAAFEMLRSSRFNSNYKSSFSETLLSLLKSIGADQYYVKYWQLYAMEAAILIIIIGIIRYRKERKETCFCIIFFFAPCALIPFESINLIWHLGTYYHYPIRCGYLIPFSLLATAAYYIGRLYGNREELRDKSDRLFNIVAICIGIALSAYALFFYFSHEAWEVRQLFKVWAAYAVLNFLLYVVIFAVKKLPKEIFIWLILSELIVGAAVGFGKPHFTDRFFSDPEQSGEYVETALELKEALPISESELYRIKNPDTSLNANYGMVMRRATVGGWANTLTRAAQRGAEELGYSTHFMRILDAGGTAFTDSLLGITEIVTLTDYEAAKGLYSELKSYDNYKLYSNRNALPYINLVFKGDIGEETGGSDIVEIHNELYRALLRGSGAADNGDIAKWVRKKGDGENSDLSFAVEGHKALYLRGGETEEILVNKNAVPVPSISEPDNKAYPAWFNSNVIFLGEFEDEEVEITCPLKSEIFELDLELLSALSKTLNNEASGRTSDSIKLNGLKLEFDISAKSEGEMALIPINFDGITGLRVNSQPARGIRVCGLMSAVELNKGDNHVVISVFPAGLRFGIIISSLTLLICLLLLFTGITIPTGLINKISLFAVEALWSLAILIIYVIPIGFFVIYEIAKRL